MYAVQQLLTELAEMREEPFRLECTALEAFFVVSTLQLACRHPDFTGPTRQVIERLARQIQATITQERPHTAILAEQGWADTPAWRCS